MNFLVDRAAPTPSSQDGVSSEVEWQLRVYGCELIQEVGILLKVYACAARVRVRPFLFFSLVRDSCCAKASSCHCNGSSFVSSVLL